MHRLHSSALIGGCIWLAAGCAAAQPWPAKPIRVIVPFAPGGFVDFTARIVAPRLSESLGVPVVIENRAGAGGITGSETVAKAPADGYTVLLTSIAHTINLSVSRNVPFDTRRDFIAVTQIADAPNLLVVHPSLPVRSVKELVALARARPGAVTYASSGSGTSTHISAELFKAMTRTDLVHVPYKGGGPAVIDLMGGHVQTMFSTMPSVVQHVRSGRLRGLAVTSETRFPGTPDIATVAESGVPGYAVSGWTGMFLPAGAPKEVAGRLADETAKILNAAGSRDRFLVQGALPRARALDEFTVFVEAEIVKWKKVVDFSGARAE